MYFLQLLYVRRRAGQLDGWCFEPGQSQRIIPGLETKLQSVSYVFCIQAIKPPNSFQIYKISANTNITQNIHAQPSNTTFLKK